MDFILCPLCGYILERKNGVNGEFASCSDYPRCKYSNGISFYSDEDKRKINYPGPHGRYGECICCRQITKLSNLGICDTCVEHENQ